MNGDYEQKSVGSKAHSKASRATSRTYRSRASTQQYLGSQKRGSVPETASRKGSYLNEKIRRSVDVAAISTKEKFDSPNKEDKEEDAVEMKKSEGELNSVQSSHEEIEKVEDFEEFQAAIAKFDADNASAVTYVTEATSALTHHPLSVSTAALTSSSKLELQLVYLAKELEREKNRRERLQKQVDEMHDAIVKQKSETESELKEHAKNKKMRETNIKPIFLDTEDARVLRRGFVSIQ